MLFAFCAVPLLAGSGDVPYQDFGLSSPPPPTWTQPLQPMFQASATKYNVPVELLLTLGFFGSGFENRGDAATIEGGYGVMALRQNSQGGDSLSLGARLTSMPEDTLKTDPAANIEAAAAVLDYYAKMWQIDRTKGIEAWLQPVIQYAGLDAEDSKFFAWEVLKRIQTGTDQVNAAGERFLVASQSIGSVDLPSLLPKGVTTSVDYGGAIWDPAGTCNYSTTTHSSDAVIIHSMEGTLAGTRSWFKNCSAQVSSHYGVGSDGTVVQFVLESQTAWHASCYNSRSVGIEHEGFAAMTAWPLAEYNASAALTKDICNRHAIPKAKVTAAPGIMSHLDVTNCCCGTHTDPGNGWNWGYYINMVNTGGVPATFDFNWTGARTSEQHNANAMMNHSECSENVDILYPFNADGTHTAEQWLKWQVTPNLTGRGWFHTDVIVPCSNGVSKPLFRMLKSDGTDKGSTIAIDECPIGGWTMIYDAFTDMNIGGWRTDTLDWSQCATNATFGWPPAYGSDPGGAGRMHMYGDQWKYIDDWTVVGPFTTANTVNDNPAGLDEANLYLYPAVDSSHGGALTFGGKTPGRVTTGNCGDGSSSLDYLNRQTAYYGTNAATYAAAWIHVPTTASPKFDIGSDDGCKLWVDQNNFWTNDASRGVIWDQDVTGPITIGQSSTGWHRVLFKIRNGQVGFGGVVSLRNGGDNRWNERSVDTYDLGGYKSYGLGYEQDTWHPLCYVTTFSGIVSPAVGAASYNPSVSASGTAAGQGPVPLWQVMWYKSGYGTGGDTNYAPVTSSGSSWSHTDTASAGHTRYYFFSASKSHRTSFQDNGTTGGSNWTGNGHGTYMDVFVDNVAPLDPSLPNAVPTAADKIQLSWSIPLDRGVGIGAGAAMDAATSGDNHYRCGDVGVMVRRGDDIAYPWGTDTTFVDADLAPNTSYSYDIQARDNNGLSRGSTCNTTARSTAVSVYTLSAPPSASNVTCDKITGSLQTTSTFTFTAIGGFGAGTVEYYKYAWDTSESHTFDGSETTWNSGDLALTATSTGKYYLHVQGFNHDDMANGTLDLGPYLYSSNPIVGGASAALAMPGAPGMVLKNKCVTAAIPGMFWLEDDNRTMGIGVVTDTPVTEGHLVDVSGTLGPWNTQRVLFAELVGDNGPGTGPAPLVVSIRSLGGSNLNASTPGTSNTGLYNVGLLVKIAGKVTYRDTMNPLAKFFYLDDGAGQIDDSGHAGVKVLCGPNDPPSSDLVTVVGVVSSEQSGLKVVPTVVVTGSSHISQF